jgi:hypothetical protein
VRLFLWTLLVGLASVHGLPAGARAPRCAGTAPTLTASANRLELVPPGATQVLLCRYHGLNPATTAHRLARGKLITNAAEVKRLTKEIDGLPKTRGRIACPMDDGSEFLARFQYPHSGPTTVSVGLTGCRTVTNGRLTRSAASTAGSRLVAQLTSLLR